MHIACFDDLLRAARAQIEPQRLLFVFTEAELPDAPTPEQRAGFARGEGGALVPRLCVDKTPDELVSFEALAHQATQLHPAWTLVFAAALGGTLHRAPSSADAQAPLQRMVDAIKAGRHEGLIPFDRQGQAVRLY
ncbi:MAG TPA: ribonucleotide reductase subunit alpha [Ottowia sp.]|nr:ribonucleotide reductase subunit alpha [Burkholderiales bacterium]HQO53556.1 ribonucleotide reductase subunit alpha [Ottowia sp.]HQQ54565.1 ribonucleotide reductase subunit alpha [Ottowia sp.]